jgi:hypothetical protein
MTLLSMFDELLKCLLMFLASLVRWSFVGNLYAIGKKIKIKNGKGQYSKPLKLVTLSWSWKDKLCSKFKATHLTPVIYKKNCKNSQPYWTEINRKNLPSYFYFANIFTFADPRSCFRSPGFFVSFVMFKFYMQNLQKPGLIVVFFVS